MKQRTSTASVLINNNLGCPDSYLKESAGPFFRNGKHWPSIEAYNAAMNGHVIEHDKGWFSEKELKSLTR